MASREYKKILILFTAILTGLLFTNPSFSQCIYSVAPTEIELPGNGGADYIYLSTGGCESYEAYTNESWLYVWADYYEHIVTVYADANH